MVEACYEVVCLSLRARAFCTIGWRQVGSVANRDELAVADLDAVTEPGGQFALAAVSGAVRCTVRVGEYFGEAMCPFALAVEVGDRFEIPQQMRTAFGMIAVVVVSVAFVAVVDSDTAETTQNVDVVHCLAAPVLVEHQQRELCRRRDMDVVVIRAGTDTSAGLVEMSDPSTRQESFDDGFEACEPSRGVRDDVDDGPDRDLCAA